MDKNDHTSMTSAEILRWCASDENAYISPIKKLSYCFTGSASYYDIQPTFIKLAEKIEEEIKDSYERGLQASFREEIKDIAEYWGWPQLEPGEHIADWISRCCFFKPRYKDTNEPIQFGYGTNEVNEVIGFAFYNSGLCTILGDSGDKQSLVSWRECADYPRRKHWGADGLEIMVDDIVYKVSDGSCWKVTRIHPGKPLIAVESVGTEVKTICRDLPASGYTHTQPDSLNLIEFYARKTFTEYWGCDGQECLRCPALVDGQTPYKRFNVENCKRAQMFDLLRRQRELFSC